MVEVELGAALPAAAAGGLCVPASCVAWSERLLLRLSYAWLDEPIGGTGLTTRGRISPAAGLASS